MGLVSAPGEVVARNEFRHSPPARQEWPWARLAGHPSTKTTSRRSRVLGGLSGASKALPCQSVHAWLSLAASGTPRPVIGRPGGARCSRSAVMEPTAPLPPIGRCNRWIPWRLGQNLPSELRDGRGEGCRPAGRLMHVNWLPSAEILAMALPARRRKQRGAGLQPTTRNFSRRVAPETGGVVGSR